jgi:hypothetical protein
MTLVYAAIAVSVCAALVLVAGMIAGRDELFGRGATAAGAERAFDRGGTPGPGTAAIPGGAAGAGLRPPGDRNLAAVSAQAGSQGPSYTGVGWPDGLSPADELWARVDAELAAAGAASREPKLTRDSSSDEVWGRVEEELASPARWNTPLVIPAAEEVVSAEREPAAEPAEQRAWAERPGWAGAADRTEQLVVVEWADTDPADRAGPAEASDREASDQGASDREAGTEVARDRDETTSDSDGAAPDHAEAVPGRDDAAPDHAEAMPDTGAAGPDRDEAGPDRDDAASDHAEAMPDAGAAGPDRDEAGPDRDGGAPDHAEAVPDAGAAAPGRDEAAPESEGALPERAEAVLGGGGAAPDHGGAGPDSAEGANGTRPPGQDADPASAAPAGNAGHEPGGDPGAELLAAPPVTDASLGSYVSAAPRSPATPYPPAAPGSPHPRPAGPGTEPGRVIVVSGVPRYHRPGCILIRFLGEDDVESVTREAAEASGCVPCRACQPDKLASAAESGAVG